MTQHVSDGEVLVVEDDIAIREALHQLLEEEGFPVIAAENGQEALDRLRKGRAPRLVLLDLMMPVMDGWQLREVMRSDPHLALIPVVVISAGVRLENAARALAADSFLSKPIALDELLTTVHRYCDPLTCTRCSPK